jgi:hypothetical protein
MRSLLALMASVLMVAWLFSAGCAEQGKGPAEPAPPAATQDAGATPGAADTGGAQPATEDPGGAQPAPPDGTTPQPPQSDVGPLSEQPQTTSPEKRRATGFYEPVDYEVAPAIDGYDLPLVRGAVMEFDSISARLALGDSAESLLNKGFLVRPYGKVEDVSEVYRDLKERNVPIFVTADTWLHLYHVQFDEILKDLEETTFYGDIVAVTDRLIESAEALHESSEGLLRDAARRNMAFLWVARKLLVVSDDPATEPAAPVPAVVAEDVAAELALIEAHGGFAQSPLFKYKDDYSQYVPRGHYTRSERLKSYFKALMWYGRMSMLLKGGDPACEFDYCPALVSTEEADVQTVQALLLTVDLGTLSAGETKVQDLWERVYQVTTFFVGLADDLTFYEYQEAISKVLGEVYDLVDLARAQNLFDLRAELAQKRSPQIYGGTGGQVIVVEPGESITPEMLDKLLDKSKGMRFMGQRFIPDSFAMGRLVSPGAGKLAGSTDAFTAVFTEAGWIRGFPRGLDVMALLGSKRAKALLSELGDDSYSKYADTYAGLETFFAELPPEQWHLNLYWGWLHALKPLLTEAPEGSQTFMQTEAWQDRSMNTALASWAELRHDTILYAKQSYTPGCETTSEPPMPPPPPPGYVEPNPELFARLLALNKMTVKGLEDLDVLEGDARRRLDALGGLLQRMLDIAVTELNGEDISAADSNLLTNLADSLDMVLGGVEPAGVKTTMVADVHTDQNSKKVLEEGVGYVELLICVVRLPSGANMVAAGPALSYYEFLHPMNDRLTDEAWRELLEGDEAPRQPPWSDSYRVP